MIKITSQDKNYPLMTGILFWSGLMIMISMYITIPLTFEISKEFGVSVVEATWIGSSYSFCYAICCLIYGPLSDRFGRKVFMTTGIVVLTLISLIIGFVDNFYGVVILRGLQGMAASAFAPISLAYASEVYSIDRRVTTIGFISLGFNLATIVAQVFSTTINSMFGWRYIFIIMGALYLITSIFVIKFLPKEVPKGSNESMVDRLIQMKNHLKNNQMVISYAVTFTLLLSLIGMYTILGSYLSGETFGLNSDDILFVRATGILGMMITPFAGILSNRFNKITILRFGLIMSTLSMIFLGFGSSMILVIILSIIFVAGIALVTTMNISIVSERGGDARGSAILMNAFSLFAGASLGPIVAINFVKSGQYTFAFIIFGIILFLAFLLSMFLRKNIES